MKRIVTSLVFAGQMLALAATQVIAAAEDEPGTGGAIEGSGSEVFGTIEAPQGVAAYGSLSEGGLLNFMSNIIRIGTVVAGVWVMINFILAGWKYVTSAGDSKAPAEASSMMTNSLIGLAIIVGAYTLAAVIGLIFFGDAGYILSPTITGAT